MKMEIKLVVTNKGSNTTGTEGASNQENLQNQEFSS